MTATRITELVRVTTEFVEGTDFDDVMLQTNKGDLHLRITRFTEIPCVFLSMVGSLIICYTILRHLQSMMKLYRSVLFYAISQYVLVVFIVCAGIFQHTMDLDVNLCRVLANLNTFAVIVPAYAVLLITVVRMIFLLHPLSYHIYLKARYQNAAMVGVVVLALAISLMPQLGVCGVRVATTDVKSGNTNDTHVEYCEYEDPYKDKNCAVFYLLYIGLGYIIPIVLVIAFYIVITTVVLKSQKEHRILTKYSIRSNNAPELKSPNSRARLFLEKLQQSFTSVKSSSSASIQSTTQERGKMPWSILAVMCLNIVSTVMWLPTELASDWLYGKLEEGRDLSWLLDVMYTSLLLSMGISPLVYIVTSRSLSRLVAKDVKRLWKIFKNCKNE